MEADLVGKLVMVLLGVVGFLIIRLIRGIDDTTKAIYDLNVTVTKLGVLVGSQKDRIDQVERQTKTNWDSQQSAIELSRTRYHELINMITGARLETEILKKEIELIKNPIVLKQ